MDGLRSREKGKPFLGPALGCQSADDWAAVNLLRMRLLTCDGSPLSGLRRRRIQGSSGVSLMITGISRSRNLFEPSAYSVSRRKDSDLIAEGEIRRISALADSKAFPISSDQFSPGVKSERGSRTSAPSPTFGHPTSS